MFVLLWRICHVRLKCLVSTRDSFFCYNFSIFLLDCLSRSIYLSVSISFYYSISIFTYLYNASKTSSIYLSISIYFICLSIHISMYIYLYHMYDWEFWQRNFLFIYQLLYRVCTHVILGILAISLCFYVWVVVEGMYTCETKSFGNKHLFFMFKML